MVFLVYNVPHMNKKLIVISITAIIGFVVLAYFSTNKPVPTEFPEQAQVRTPNASDSAKIIDHTLGKGKHVLVEYSDLQCPACQAVHNYLSTEKKNDSNFAKIMEEQYTFVYRHYPLIRIHKNAEIAARSAEAAALQGKYYEFLDEAFKTQKEWSEMAKAREFFVDIAKTLGLEEEQFVKDVDSVGVTEKIGADIALADKANIRGTPTFFIDGELVEFGSFDQLKKSIIDSAKN